MPLRLSVQSLSSRLSVGLISTLLLIPVAQALPPNYTSLTPVIMASESGNEEGDWGEEHRGKQTSTGSRNDCPDVAADLTALIPTTKWGKTVSQSPTFWFYVPYTSEQIAFGKFILQNQQGFNQIEPIKFTVHQTPGFVSFTLPETTPPLELWTDYYWAFELYCSPTTRSPIYVAGWIQSVLPNGDINEQLYAETPQIYQVYWEKMIWFDAVNELIQQRLKQPNDRTLEAEWLRLLQDAGLDTEQLPTEPILGTVIMED